MMANGPMLLICFLVLFGHERSTTGANGAGVVTNPGFKVAITSKGLDYVDKIGLPILEKALSATTIPDISGKASIGIGDVDYTLTNIKITNLQIPQSSITTSEAGITIQASGISVSVTADWSYKIHSIIPVSDHGSADVDASSVTLSVSVTMGTTTSGHPTLSSTGCSFDVGKLDITFHGGASWLYNLFSDYISGELKKSMNDQMCSAATKAIDTAGNAALQSLPIEIRIDDVSEVSYALVQAPSFTSSYLETAHKGEFYFISKPVEAPFTPPPLPPSPPANASQMMYLWLTDYIANTAGFVYQTAGVLQYNVTPDMVPPQVPIKLNTSSFKLLIPELYNKYPNMAMKLELDAVKPPTLKIAPSGANFTLPGEVKVFVLTPKNGTVLAFTLGTGMYANVSVWVRSNGTAEFVSANATYLSTDITLSYTTIGKFDVSLLQTAVNTVCKYLVIPVLNKYGKVGFPIPTVDGVSFVNPTIAFGKDFLLLSTDFSYNTTSKLMLNG